MDPNKTNPDPRANLAQGKSGMPVLTRCRSKTPEGRAMRPSPNPKKLKKAAKKLRENKKAPEGAKTALKAENSAVVKTPSPKPILKSKEEPRVWWVCCVQASSMGPSFLQVAICKYTYEN